MRLSEAIRLGATVTGQCFGIFEDEGGDKTCAVGAALRAAGLNYEDTYTWTHVFPIIEQISRTQACPECGIRQAGLLFHINDDHHWKREVIADWVESIEAQQPTAPPVEVACE